MALSSSLRNLICLRTPLSLTYSSSSSLESLERSGFITPVETSIRVVAIFLSSVGSLE
uniref:Uncharacterized protein n=1 Tax=Arundo donax TaxID=35708 RepID=A0A0A8YXB8_ARUDO